MQTDIPPTPTTISQVEEVVQSGLEALRSAPLSPQIMAALSFLVPTGYRPVVQLEEDGRKKRSTASASNWAPETGEIVIYFEPLGTKYKQDKTETQTPAPADDFSSSARTNSASVPSEEAAPAEVGVLQVQQCCNALAEAEKAGKSFIAFKWFRDEALASLPYEWSKGTDSRYRVLAKAVETGAILTKRIPNPKSSLHPTTTVSLNRANASTAVPSRFHPISVKGEPVSVTITRDRGSI